MIGGWVPGRGSLHGLPGALLLGELRDHQGLRYVVSADATRTRAGLLRHPSFHRLRLDLARLGVGGDGSALRWGGDGVRHAMHGVARLHNLALTG